MTSRTSLLLYLVALLVSPLLQAQDKTESADEDVTVSLQCAKSDDKSFVKGTCHCPQANDKGGIAVARQCLQPWVLSNGARIARAFQYQLGLQEQLGTATVQAGSTVQFIPNPERYLIKHSLTFAFSELFLTPTDFGNALKSFYDNRPPQAGESLDLKNLCKHGKRPDLDCLATSGLWWHRALSGVTVTFSISERTRAMSGVILPDRPFPQGYDKSGEIDFNPSQIFMVGSNWKNAADSLVHIQRARSGTELAESMCVPDPKHSDSKRHSDDTLAKCLVRAYGGSKGGWIGFLAAALPTFKFIRQTQFDFLKNGGSFIPAPFPEGALNNYAFTWDLKRLIAPTKERVAATDVLTIKGRAASEAGTKLCVTITNGQKSYMPISDSFPESSCERFAQVMSGGHFKLACVAKNGDISFGDESGHRPMRSVCWSDDSQTALGQMTSSE